MPSIGYHVESFLFGPESHDYWPGVSVLGVPRLLKSVTDFDITDLERGVELQGAVGQVHDRSCRILNFFMLQFRLRYSRYTEVIPPSVLFERIVIITKLPYLSLEISNGSILVL